MTGDWTQINRALWEERAGPHARSADYAFDRFGADPEFISDVVRFDRPRLGDIRGLRGVHLQCHIGTDTLSLHRLGARMTGLDFSPASLAEARALAQRVGADIDYHHGDLYDAADVLGDGGFDLVYTGIGALCWLPDVHRWGEVVGRLLAPGGSLFLREGHPMLWALDDRDAAGPLAVEYPYFETAEPLLFEEDGTYVETDHRFVNVRTASWNHGVGEVVTALLDAGLRLTMLVEHDSVPWDALPGRMQRLPSGEFRLAERPERVAHTYTLRAVRPERAE